LELSFNDPELRLKGLIIEFRPDGKVLLNVDE